MCLYCKHFNMYRTDMWSYDDLLSFRCANCKEYFCVSRYSDASVPAQIVKFTLRDLATGDDYTITDYPYTSKDRPYLGFKIEKDIQGVGISVKKFLIPAFKVDFSNREKIIEQIKIFSMLI